MNENQQETIFIAYNLGDSRDFVFFPVVQPSPPDLIGAIPADVPSIVEGSPPCLVQ
jgi:hypothetical protein